MAEKNELTIAKLEGTKNWQVWKYQMQTVLEAKDLWGYVDGTNTRPASNADQQAAFDKSEKKAKALLVTAINSDLVYLITECQKPKQIWDKLKQRFERDTIASKLFLKQKYFSMKMKDDDSIEEHLRRMKEITDQLAAIRAPIPEEEQIVAILLSLPRNYNTIVTALTAKGDDLQLSQVQQALINEEEKRLQIKVSKSNDNRFDKGESALRHEKSTRKPIRCYECNQEGHISRNCPQKNAWKGTKPRGVQKLSKHKASAANTEDSDESTKQLFATGFITSSKDENKWIVDSGASQHMTANRQLLIDYEEFSKPEPVTLGDGYAVNAHGQGKVSIIMMLGTREKNKKESFLTKVFYVPKLACNLFSVRAATSHEYIVQLGHSLCWIKDPNGKVAARGKLSGNMYQLDCQVEKPANQASVATHSDDKLDLWHQRMAHLNIGQMKKMISKNLTMGLDASGAKKLTFCEPCAESKACRKPFKPTGRIQSNQRLQLVHSDVAGPMKNESFGGAKYFVTFIDVKKSSY
jgi:hypothetical protein